MALFNKKIDAEHELTAAARSLDTASSIGDSTYVRSLLPAARAAAKKPYEWYNGIGEIHYAVDRGARIAGYAQLYVCKVRPDGEPGDIVERGLEGAIGRSLISPYGGMRELVSRFYKHMTVPGDCLLIKSRDGKDFAGYETLSPEECQLADEDGFGAASRNMHVNGLRRYTMPPAGIGNVERTAIAQEIAAQDVLGRIWRPSSQWIDLADTPLKAIQTQCEILHLLTVNLKAKLLSRLALNGILFVPSELNEITYPFGKQGPAMSTIDRLMLVATESVLNHDRPESAVPVMVAGNKDLAEAIRFIEMDRAILETDMKLRAELLDRILMSLDVQPMDVKGMGDSNHWCLDDQTEIMTKRGWMGIDDLVVGDEVLALNHETGLSEWRVVTDRYDADVIDEPMRLLESRTHSSLTTMHHRWPTVTRDGRRRWVTTGQMGTNDRITTGAPCVDVPAIAKFSDALVEILGWFWTEGNVSASTTIAQSHTANPDKVARIRAALRAEFGDDGFTEAIQRNDSSFGGPITVFRLRSPAAAVLADLAPGKRIADWVVDSFTAAQLHLFIDVSCMGDGHHWKTGERDIWQRDPSALDAFERACVLAGYGVSRQPGHDGGTVVRALRSVGVRPVKAAGEMARRNAVGATDEIVSYTGRIWCPTVDGLNSYLARRNGRSFFTGNSAWAVSDDERRINIQPIVEMFCWALTKTVLWREMLDAGKTAAACRNYMVWYDLTDANVKTNLAEDGRQLHDRIVVSSKAARRMSGVEETDAPSEEEYVRQLGVKNGDPYLATFGLEVAKKIDWDKVAVQPKTGPDAQSPADKPKVSSGTGKKPGGPTPESNTPRSKRPA